ncbi:hypothetical protein ACHWQZ_G014619 [Mnemiopsis leidyi]
MSPKKVNMTSGRITGTCLRMFRQVSGQSYRRICSRNPPGTWFDKKSVFQQHHRKCPLFVKLLTTETSNFDVVVVETLETLTEALEELPDFIPDVPELFDVEYNGEVLTLKIKEGFTYVINRQTPNQQIWLSSPISGPKRYDFVDGQWIYSHDGSSMIDLLESELSELLDFEFELNTVRHCLLPFS